LLELASPLSLRELPRGLRQELREPRSQPRPGNAPDGLSNTLAPNRSHGNASRRLYHGGPTQESTGEPVRPCHAMVHSVHAQALDIRSAPAPPSALPQGRAGVARGSSLKHPFFWETRSCTVETRASREKADSDHVALDFTSAPLALGLGGKLTSSLAVSIASPPPCSDLVHATCPRSVDLTRPGQPVMWLSGTGAGHALLERWRPVADMQRRET